jgi:HEPN domain-containing protein
MGESLPGPEQREYAQVLLRRAESDLRACRKLAADEAMGDDVVGFHAQQAVEKSLKAVLVLAGVPFPRTHDLDFLLARAEGHRLEVPPRYRMAVPLGGPAPVRRGRRRP